MVLEVVQITTATPNPVAVAGAARSLAPTTNGPTFITLDLSKPKLSRLITTIPTRLGGHALASPATCFDFAPEWLSTVFAKMLCHDS